MNRYEDVTLRCTPHSSLLFVNIINFKQLLFFLSCKYAVIDRLLTYHSNPVTLTLVFTEVVDVVNKIQFLYAASYSLNILVHML